jgi:hypothetical protein
MERKINSLMFWVSGRRRKVPGPRRRDHDTTRDNDRKKTVRTRDGKKNHERRCILFLTSQAP